MISEDFGVTYVCSMEIALPSTISENPPTFLRRLGYGREARRSKGEESFVRRLTGAPFPRFHVYVVALSKADASHVSRGSAISRDSEVTQNQCPAAGSGSTRNIVLRIHLDQKAPSYQGSHAHAGEYHGPLVAQEVERIRALSSYDRRRRD